MTATYPKITILPISKLNPYKNNPKEHPEKQVQQIANSIREFDFIIPIVVDKIAAVRPDYEKEEAEYWAMKKETLRSIYHGMKENKK